MRLKKRSGKASEEINVTHNADDIENIDMTEGEEHTEKIPVQAVQSELEAEGVEVEDEQSTDNGMAGESADAEEETERAGGITEDFSDGGETQEPLPEAADTESGENAEDLEEENDKGNGKRRKRRGRSSENGKRRRRRRGRKKREFKKPGKKFFIITGGVIGGLILIYLGISAYFISHFFVNTTINGKDFSGKSAKAVEEYIRGEVNGYELTIIEQNNDRNIIKGSEIGLTYKESSEIEDALKKQNPLLWPAGFFSQSSTQVSVGVDYDEALLDEKLQSIKAMSKEQTEPVSAYPKYNGNLFEVEPEVYGSAVDTEALKEKTVQYITEFRDSLNMMDEGCYKMPAYTSDSEEVKNACNTMNQYLKAKITYTMDEEVVVDKDLISQWVTCDSEMNVTFNEEAVKAWMREFGEKYDTVGKTRSFTTPDGKQTQVSGGTYGWIVNEAQEAQNLIENIKNGENITKEPEYKQTAASRSALDWGTTYAEVDLAAQKMWFVVDGSVALTTDVVTGRPSTGNATPEGVYDILYTQRGAVLRGDIDPATGKPSYETPVSFWMPFTYQGHGFHDATWQSAFGGNRYLTHGSHGCVNMPYDKASHLFELITAGTPVIIHS